MSDTEDIKMTDSTTAVASAEPPTEDVNPLDSDSENEEMEEKKGQKGQDGQEDVDDEEVMGLDEPEPRIIAVFSTKGLPDVSKAQTPQEEKEIRELWNQRPRYHVDAKALEGSKVFMTMLEDESADEMPCPGASDEVLRYILHYLIEHQRLGYKTKENKEPANILKPLKHDRFADNVADPWDAQFIERVMTDLPGTLVLDQPNTDADTKEVIDLTSEVGTSEPETKAQSETKASSSSVERKENTWGKPRLFEMVKAANYLDIQSLLWLACGKVASMVRRKSPDQAVRILDESIPLGQA